MKQPVLLLLAAGLLCACGYKAPPQPLQQPLPEAVEDLRVEQLGATLRLSWQLPTRNQDGSKLNDLQSIELYRAVVDPKDNCLQCGDADRPWREIDLDFLGEVQQRGRRLWLLDRAVEPEAAYRYRLTPVNKTGHRGRIARAQSQLVAPLPAPSGLMAVGQDRLVQLHWSAASPQPGIELLGYRIYRGPADQPLSLQSLTPEPLNKTDYTDPQVQNGQTYRYAIRSVHKRQDQTYESKLSPLQSATPHSGI